MTKTYTRQQADEILRRALAVQPAEGISHEDLVAAAREVGIPSAAIDAAARELTEDQRSCERADQIRKRRRVAFLCHLLICLVVNAGILFVDHADGGAYWFQYPLILWGVVVAAIGIAQLAPKRASLLRQAERELERERRRAQRRSLRMARKDGTREFEVAVQEGVNTLLSAAARSIRGLSAAGRRYRVNGEEAEDGPAPAATGPAEARSRRKLD